VVNYAIAQAGGRLILKILGVDHALFDEVLSFRTAYDASTRSYVPADAVSDMGTAKWGAEVLRMWIDEFSIEDAIQQELASIMNAFCKKDPKQTRRTGVGEFKRKPGPFLVVGDWYFFPSDSCTYEDLPAFIGKEIFHSDETRLTYLLNLQGNKDRLYSAISEYIMVVPLGMRPDIGQAHDQLSHAYADVIAANKNLRMIISGMQDPKVFAQKYKVLSDRVNSLLAVHSASKTVTAGKSVIEKLSGKQGLIRAKMLGRRVDFSGRSVITINPFLSLRKVQIPKEAAPKLYRSHILSSMANPNPVDWIGPDKTAKCNARLIDAHILEKVPVIIGRQPTLHKLSIRAFQPELTDERSIRINPLCVTGFNADFDGDQMWMRVPVSRGAVEEAKELMTIEQNIYYPKNGECSVMPRQEILYGLNVCTRDTLQKGSSIKSYSSEEDLFEDLFNQRIKVSDTVTWNGYTECAGRVAFAACLSKKAFQTFGVKEVTSKTIVEYVEAMLEESTDSAIDSIDKMVKLGFKISYLYPPVLNLLNVDDSYEEEMQNFHQAIKETADYYERGLEEESTFDTVYEQAFMALEDSVKKSIYSHVGLESGFTRLAESGARGSKSNMVQMYGYKGRIQKSARESFRAVVEHSYVEQLTPLEHFVTAYGGRQGLITKSLNSADTGYAFRMMWHAASPYVITSDDCGTHEGITIKKADIAMFINSAKEVDDVFCKIITGRFEAGTNLYISKEIAKELCKKNSAITIRSILTCNDPCCKKCYGDDPSTHKLAAISLPIGFIAAQSIGEPGTQLSMDSFKKGGIASKKGITSSFAKLDAYIQCRPMSERANYDPVAWESGPVHESYQADGTKRVTIGESKHSIKLPGEAMLRQTAVKGEGLCVERGDYDINELLQYTSLQTAQVYLLHTLYQIYKDECEISMKHFEVLVAAMTMYMVVSTDRKDLKVGQYHDSIQMHSGSLKNTVYFPTIRGVKEVQPSRTHALSRVIMESVKSGLASSLMLGLDDPLEYPLNRIVMGQYITCGGTGDFLEERRI